MAYILWSKFKIKIPRSINQKISLIYVTFTLNLFTLLYSSYLYSLMSLDHMLIFWIAKEIYHGWLIPFASYRHRDLNANANWYFVLGCHGRSRRIGKESFESSASIEKRRKNFAAYCTVYNIYVSNAIERNCPQNILNAWDHPHNHHPQS